MSTAQACPRCRMPLPPAPPGTVVRCPSCSAQLQRRGEPSPQVEEDDSPASAARPWIVLRYLAWGVAFATGFLGCAGLLVDRGNLAGSALIAAGCACVYLMARAVDAVSRD